MTETFQSRHNGVDVLATLDTDTWQVTKIVYKCLPEMEVDTNLETFTDYHDWEIDIIKGEILAEEKEYGQHIEIERRFAKVI